jgi:purine-binding chemotaxis protein CheW
MSLRAIQDADQLVSDYLSALLKPAPSSLIEQPPKQHAPSQARAPVSPRTAEPADVESPARYLLCMAAGVRLALPMGEVRHMVPMPPMRPVAGDPAVCLGRWRHPGGEAKVVDLAAILAPDMAGAEADTLLLLHDRSWALACTVYEESVKLAPDGIAWRTPSASRPWLVGMMRELRCGVIDVTALIDTLERLEAEGS